MTSLARVTPSPNPDGHITSPRASPVVMLKGTMGGRSSPKEQTPPGPCRLREVMGSEGVRLSVLKNIGLAEFGRLATTCKGMRNDVRAYLAPERILPSGSSPSSRVFRDWSWLIIKPMPLEQNCMLGLSTHYGFPQNNGSLGLLIGALSDRLSYLRIEDAHATQAELANLLDTAITRCGFSNKKHPHLRSVSLVFDNGQQAEGMIKELVSKCPNLGRLCIQRERRGQMPLVDAVDFTCPQKLREFEDRNGVLSVSSLLALLHDCTELRHLLINHYDTPIDNTVIFFIGKNPRLHVIDLNDCTGVTDRTLLAMAKKELPLQALHLSRCENITDAGLLAVLEKAPFLESLDVSGCSNLTPCSFVDLHKKCPRLKRLVIGGSQTERRGASLSISIKPILGLLDNCLEGVFQDFGGKLAIIYKDTTPSGLRGVAVRLATQPVFDIRGKRRLF